MSYRQLAILFYKQAEHTCVLHETTEKIDVKTNLFYERLILS